jgi:hypothetical protein
VAEVPTFTDYLNSIHASRDVVQQALRLYVAEETDFMPVGDMRGELEAATADPTAVSEQLLKLESSSKQLEQVALLYLSAAWVDPAQRDQVRAALDAANKSLPVLEAATLAVVAMYAMYLATTKGKAKEKHTVEHRPDGSFEETSETTYANPTPWLRGILGLFGRGKDAEAET